VVVWPLSLGEGLGWAPAPLASIPNHRNHTSIPDPSPSRGKGVGGRLRARAPCNLQTRQQHSPCIIAGAKRLADTTPESREEREAHWWRDWWAADYSWDGLAKKEILGGGQWGEKTLQDYWRRDPATREARSDAALKTSGELVELDGRWWHLAHLPRLGGRDGGTFSWKTSLDAPEWARLSAILAERLTLAKETPGEFGFSDSRGTVVYQPSGADRRARLDGTVVSALPLRAPPPGGDVEPIHLICDRAMFLADLDHTGAAFGPGASFASALFSGRARFHGTIFLKLARFNNTIFSKTASFTRAIFYGDVYLNRAIFLENAEFGGTEFGGKVEFSDSIFSGFAGFYSAMFRRSAIFERTIFTLESGFNSAIFYHDSSFRGARFLGDVSFFRANFCMDANFRSIAFCGFAIFQDAEFLGDATFSNSQFDRAANFSGSFGRGGSFRSAVFDHQVTFSSRVDRPEEGFAGAFYGARFADIADFSKSGPPRPGTDRNDGSRMAIAFAEALFEKTLILTDGSDQDAAQAFREGTMKVVRETPKGQERDDLLDRLEAGCRTVKIAMGKARDEAREQRYYRFQLQARQARGDTHWTEKRFGQLYGLVSDYGGSLGRPLGWWIGLAVLLGLVYWLWAGGMNGTLAGDLAGIAAAPLSGESWANPAAAMSFSAGRSLFLNAWLGVPDKDPTTWQWIFLHGYGPGWGLLVRLVSAFQSILSGILLFLFALAVRRRFQIGG